MNGSLAVAVLPWVVFAVAARTGGLGLREAALLALASSLAVCLQARRRGRLRGLEVAGVATFGALGLVGLAVGHSEPLDDYARVLGAGCLGLVALGSMVAGRPVTQAFTTDSVPPDIAESGSFARLNRGLTACFGTGAVAAAGSFAVGAAFEGQLWGLTVFNWLVPIALVVGCVRCLFAQWRAAALDEDAEEQVLLASLTTSRPALVPLAGGGGVEHRNVLGHPSAGRATLRPVRDGTGS